MIKKLLAFTLLQLMVFVTFAAQCPNNSRDQPSPTDINTIDNLMVDRICGSVSIPPNSPLLGIFGPNAAEISAQRTNLLLTALENAQQNLDTSARELLLDPTGASSGSIPSTWQFTSNPIYAARTIKAEIAKLNFNLRQQMGNDYVTNIVTKSIADGWIHAGSYYFQLIRSSQVNSDFQINFNIADADYDKIKSLLDSCFVDSKTKATLYLGESVKVLSQNSIELPRNFEMTSAGASTSGKLRSALSVILGGLMKSITNALMKRLTEGNVDPLASMASLGAVVTTTVEIIFFASLGGAFVLWLASSVMFCLQPVGPAMLGLTKMVVPFATLLLIVAYVAGVTLALYVPMIPFLVFLFASIGWMVLVIEAVIAAPLVALGMIIPSEDELGKAAHALVILLGLFLRPALMIVGFVLSVELLRIGIDMLNFGFKATYESSSMATAFSVIAVLFIYAGIVTAFVHEAFSLIYVLPDKVLRWMGGQEETTSVKGQVQGLEGNVKKGAGVASGAIKMVGKAAISAGKGAGKAGKGAGKGKGKGGGVKG